MCLFPLKRKLFQGTRVTFWVCFCTMRLKGSFWKIISENSKDSLVYLSHVGCFRNHQQVLTFTTFCHLKKSFFHLLYQSDFFVFFPSSFTYTLFPCCLFFVLLVVLLCLLIDPYLVHLYSFAQCHSVNF